MPVIYIDVLFFTNLILDSILLVITGALSGKDFSVLRLLAGGLLGGIYGVCVFFSPLCFLSAWLIRLAISSVMVGISFGFKPLKDFLRILLNFYISSFLLGGGLSALFFLSGRPAVMANGIYYFPMSVLGLIAAAIPLGVTLIFYYRKSKNRLMSHGKYCTVTIGFAGKTITAPGIIDTGCMLTDPYCKKPVVIIDPDMAKDVESDENFTFRLIPFSTVDSAGVMKAFSPDCCILTTQKKTFNCNCTVAVSPAYSGGKIIINPDVLTTLGGVKNEL